MKITKKTVAVFLTMIMLAAMLTCWVMAEENEAADCFRFDYSKSNIKAQYAEWYFSDYATADVARDTGTLNVLSRGAAIRIMIAPLKFFFPRIPTAKRILLPSLSWAN